MDQGNSDGVDLGGTRVVLTADWPGNFFAGNGTARLYIDEGANADQRRELEAIFTGTKGGLLEPLWDAVVAKWLPTQVTNIDIQWGDNPSVTVGSVGQAKLTPLKDQSGRPTQVAGAASQAAFQIESMTLASSRPGSAPLGRRFRHSPYLRLAGLSVRHALTYPPPRPARPRTLGLSIVSRGLQWCG